MAKPQEGVDALKGKFPRPTQSIPGIESKKSSDSIQQKSK